MFGLFHKNEEVELKSICIGEIIPIDNVPDKMFAKRLLGDGIGFTFKEEKIYAPCDGEVLVVANTQHAIGIKLKNGAELLIHVGLDTVNLNGQGLVSLVKKGEKVKCGQEIMRIDQEFMKDHGINLITPMILTSSEGYHLSIIRNMGNVQRDDIVMKVMKV